MRNMRKRTYVYIAMAIALAAAALNVLRATAAQGDAPEVPEFYCYSEREGTVYITLSTERIGIRFEEGLSLEEQAVIVASEPDLGPFDERLQLAMLEKRRTAVVPLKPGASASTIFALIDNLNGRPGVESATPVFQFVPGFDELLTDQFYASFPVSTPEEDILALNDQHSVEVIGKRDYSIIGKIGYILKVTVQSTMNALQMANLYYEHPLTIGSAPYFLSLYPAADPIEPPLGMAADVSHSGVVDAVDVQLVINAALGFALPYDCDLDNSGQVDAVDVQLVVNGALGIG